MSAQNAVTNIFGHRGSAGTHPENTMISFQAAEHAGAEGIEFDIQLSRDGVPVIIHDETLERTTNGKGWVKDLTFSELQQLDAGAWFSEKYKGTKIPALEEVLTWAQGNRLLLNLELKTGIVKYPQMEEKVIRLVEQYDLTHRVILLRLTTTASLTSVEFIPVLKLPFCFWKGCMSRGIMRNRWGPRGCIVPGRLR